MHPPLLSHLSPPSLLFLAIALSVYLFIATRVKGLFTLLVAMETIYGTEAAAVTICLLQNHVDPRVFGGLNPLQMQI